MTENNGNTPEPAQVPVTFESLDQALAKIKDLENTLQGAVSGREYWEDLANSRAETIVQARNLIQEILEGDINAKQTFEDFKEPFELLGVEITRTVEIEVSITWRGNIELPLGVEVSELDIDDFDVAFNGHNEYETDMNTWYEDYDISER